MKRKKEKKRIGREGKKTAFFVFSLWLKAFNSSSWGIYLDVVSLQKERKKKKKKTRNENGVYVR